MSIRHVRKTGNIFSESSSPTPRGGYSGVSSHVRHHFKSNRLSAGHLFNLDDQQDVQMTFDMVEDIWSLPCTTSQLNSRPGSFGCSRSVVDLGKLLYHPVFPYLCVDLSSSEQVEHLGAAAHLTLAL